MREVIMLHVGQAGVQIGNACWELFCLEHGIQPSGLPNEDHTSSEMQSVSTFFQQTKRGNYTPRCVNFDLDPTTIDEIRTGQYRQLYHPNQLINGKQNAADNFAIGHYYRGRHYTDDVLDRIQKEVERCQSLEGFIITHSVSGGTGAGFGSLLLERMSVHYGRKSKFSLTVYPSKHYGGTVQPYNCVLSTHSLLEHTDLSVLVDNESMYDITTRSMDVDQPSYSNINRLISQILSSMTVGVRFSGPQNINMQKLQTNLVAYPRIHFVLASYAPLLPSDRTYIDQPSVYQITQACFDHRNVTNFCNYDYGKFIASSLIYRGDVLPKDAIESAHQLKNKSTVLWSDWAPTGLQVSINSQPLTSPKNSQLYRAKRSCCMLASHHCVAETFSSIDHKFDLMYAKRAFVHWMVGDGMEQGEFSQARQDLAALQKDYEDWSLGDYEDWGEEQNPYDEY